MREIKFRAWDNLSKKIVAFDGRKWCRKYGQHINIQCATEKEDTVLKLISKFFYGSDLELIYMQYTGLKDKNDVEIYEGDIVKINENLYEVWHSGLAFGLIDKNKNFFEYMCQLCDMNGKVYEVIGNIYENPEFLKED